MRTYCERPYCTYHVVSDELQMPAVHLDVVRAENATHLSQDRRTRHLNTVRLQDRVDIVRVHVVLVDDALLQVRSEVPDPRQVGAVRRELQAR